MLPDEATKLRAQIARLKNKLAAARSGMLCSVCIYLPGFGLGDEGVHPADTIINGQAVCMDHTGYVAGGCHSEALAAIARARGVSAS